MLDVQRSMLGACFAGSVPVSRMLTKTTPPTADQMAWLDRLTRGAPVPEADQENLPASKYLFP